MYACVERHQTVILVNVFKNYGLETSLKGDNVQALIKTSNCENFDLHFSVAVPFWFSVHKQSIEKCFGFPQGPETPTLPTSLKIQRHFNTTTAFHNSLK